MNTLEEIKPIVNGSVNPNLTPELFSALEPATKRQVIWNIAVSMEFAHTFPDVDPKVFVLSDYKLGHDQVWNQTPDEELQALFIEVRARSEAHHNLMRSKTADYRFELGKRIHAAQKELGFGGWMSLDKDRMMGYITAGGSWNDFDCKKVAHALNKLHEIAPRLDYGLNNPNSGRINHVWKSVSGNEYLTLEYDFIDGKQLLRVKEFYQKHWEPVGRGIKADSIRFEETDHGNGYYGIELIWWWD